MWKAVLTSLTLLSAQSIWAQGTAEQPDRANPVGEHYNLEDGNLGLKGYDPVGYLEKGMALQGRPELTLEYGGVRYQFSSQENLDLFVSSPTKYEPTYGGWCAWAMANRQYADIDPTLFTVNGQRAHFFINRGAKARFDQDLATREADADAYWKEESGEGPRL